MRNTWKVLKRGAGEGWNSLINYARNEDVLFSRHNQQDATL